MEIEWQDQSGAGGFRSAALDRAIAAAKSAVARGKPAVSESEFARLIRNDPGLELTSHQRFEVKIEVDPETRGLIGRIVAEGTGEVLRRLSNEEMLRYLAVSRPVGGGTVDSTW